jgi:hypothetical protein
MDGALLYAKKLTRYINCNRATVADALAGSVVKIVLPAKEIGNRSAKMAVGLVPHPVWMVELA